LFDIFSQMPRNAVHPNDHRNDEDRSQQEHQAFKAVFVDLPALEGDGYGEAERTGDRNTRPDKSREVRTAGPGQINEYDAYDESSFDTLAEGNEKC
jgi:hypothetical protein